MDTCWVSVQKYWQVNFIWKTSDCFTPEEVGCRLNVNVSKRSQQVLVNSNAQSAALYTVSRLQILCLTTVDVRGIAAEEDSALRLRNSQVSSSYKVQQHFALVVMQRLRYYRNTAWLGCTVRILYKMIGVSAWISFLYEVWWMNDLMGVLFASFYSCMCCMQTAA